MPRYEVWNAGGTAELVKEIQERSDDIERVVITPDGVISLWEPTNPTDREVIEASLVIHFCSGFLRIIPSRQDAQTLLDDGIFARMNIRVEKHAANSEACDGR
jgi:hypothetical protein